MSEEPKKKATEAQIDENLKRVYQEVLDEELPDRFKDLLARLKSQGSKDGSEGSE